MNDMYVRYENKAIPIRPDETVLDGLERAGVFVPSSCRAGACQFCMLKAVEGKVPSQSQQGLKPHLKASGHFLACICRPKEPLACVPAHTADFRGQVIIQEVHSIGSDVVRVRFHKPEGFSYLPGQFITLTQGERLSRSYSIASFESENSTFDIHVRRVAQGRMSSWFHDVARSGDRLMMEGPKGECVYYPGSPDEPLTLIGTGTGIAPLYAIINDALRQKHRGPITLYQGAVSEKSLYFEREMDQLAQNHANVRYVKCVLQKPTREGLTLGDLKSIASSELTDQDIRRIYLCGDPGLVRLLKKTFFLAGVSMKRIHADPFVVNTVTKDSSE